MTTHDATGNDETGDGATGSGAAAATPSPEAHAAAYRGIRERVRAVVASADRAAPCPLTPAWSVGDTLAHLVGVAADVTEGRVDGAATDPWTQAQVDARRGRTVASMLDEWETTGPGLETIMLALPIVISGQIVFDAVTHEHDLRHALGRSGGHDSDAVAIAAGWIAGFAGAAKAETPGTIEIAYGSRTVRWGTGAPLSHARVSEFEFVRAVSGRRSAAQLAAQGWPSTSAALAASIFSAAPTDISE